MKPGRTLALLGAFLALLAAVLLFEGRGKKRAAEKERASRIADVAAADVVKLSLRNAGGPLTLERDDKGDWRITEPLVAAADSYEADGLASAVSGASIERVVEAEASDPASYGIPEKEVTLWVKGRTDPVRLLVGMENPIDKTLFAMRADEKRVVLLPSSLKTSLDKTLFDLRKKDVFRFEAADVGSVRVRAGDAAWRAVRKDGQWFLESPVAALAQKSLVDALVDTLAGLRAKEFVSETKAEEDVRAQGLDTPGYEAVLSLPTENKEVVLAFAKNGDRTCAMSSLADKIVLVEGTILADLERKPGEYREKKAAVFDSWDADRVAVTSGAATVAVVKEKSGDAETWRMESGSRPEADGSKVETFIRKISGLEAAEFIDAPKVLAEYGLDQPRAEVRVRTRSYDGKVGEAILLIGAEDKDRKQVIVKNAVLDYLFRVDAAFLQDLPKGEMDWAAARAEKAEDAAKAP